MVRGNHCYPVGTKWGLVDKNYMSAWVVEPRGQILRVGIVTESLHGLRELVGFAPFRG
jgi:hypothetical protein